MVKWSSAQPAVQYRSVMRRERPAIKHQLPPCVKVILIGGTSHVGKSTLARAISDGLAWEDRSTDKLARHPGRPWRNDGGDIPAHVIEHYATLSTGELVDDVLSHYEKNVLPQVTAMVRARASGLSLGGIVLEGSALWPSFVAPLLSDHVAAVWLIGSHELLTKRIRAESRYDQKSPADRLLIDAFRERTIAFAAKMAKAIQSQGLPVVELREGEPLDALVARCLQLAAAQDRGPATK